MDDIIEASAMRQYMREVRVQQIVVVAKAEEGKLKCFAGLPGLGIE